MPDPVNHPSQWIVVEMERAGAHPHWSKEIRASEKFTMGSGPRRYTIGEDLNKPKTLHFAQWQAVPFGLPLTQKEASGLWDAPPCFHGLCPHDFLPYADVSGTEDF